MTPNKELTSSNKLAWRHYKRLSDKLGRPPSVRELADALDVSHNAAHYQIQQLRDKGILAERRVTATRLQLTAKGRRKTS